LDCGVGEVDGELEGPVVGPMTVVPGWEGTVVISEITDGALL
jgi:hypothetical protein